MKHKYPCDRCIKQCRSTGSNYLKCQAFRAWVHEFWCGLEGAEERLNYRKLNYQDWIQLLIERTGGGTR